MRSRGIALAVFGLWSASCLPGPPTDSEPALEAEVGAYLQAYVAGGNFSGTILVARAGRVLLHEGYGAADLEQEVPNEADTTFHIASLSKTFTAAAILQLADRGLLTLSDPLESYVPGFPGGDRITVHHLLTHTSGIPDINRFPEYRELSQSPQRPEDLVAVIRTRQPRGQPGERYGYSNSNYNLLAYILERVSGAPYGAYLERELLAPLEMTETGHDDGSAIPRAAVGYVPVEVEDLAPAPHLDWSVKTGNGSLYSTAEDLLLWASAIDDGGLLSEHARSLLLTPHVDDRIGYGWFLGEKFGRPVAYMNGNSPGFSSYLALYPQDDVVVVVLANNDIPLATSIGGDLAAMLFGAEYEAPGPLLAVAPPPGALDGVSGSYRFPYGLTLDLTTRDERLYSRSVWPLYESRLIPIGENEFFHRYHWSSLILERSPDGAVASVYWKGSPGSKAERIEG